MSSKYLDLCVWQMYTELLAQYEDTKAPPALTRLHTQQPGPHPEHASYDWWNFITQTQSLKASCSSIHGVTQYILFINNLSPWTVASLVTYSPQTQGFCFCCANKSNECEHLLAVPKMGLVITVLFSLYQWQTNFLGMPCLKDRNMSFQAVTILI